MKKNITLAYSYGFDNPGDYAITPGAINAIRSVDENIFITIISSYTPNHNIFLKTKKILETKYDNLEVIPNDLFYKKKKKSIIYKFRILISILLNRSQNLTYSKSKMLKSLLKSDMLVFNGGHIFFWDKLMGEKRNIFINYFLVSKVYSNLNLKYGIYANSFGPFNFEKNILVKKLFRIFFNNASFLLARDAESKEYLKPLYLKHEIKTVLDPAFYLQDEKRDMVQKFIRMNGLIDKQFICFSFRLSNRGSITDLPKLRTENYIKHLKAVLSHAIINTDYPLLMIKQVDRDELDMKKVLSQINIDYDENRIIYVDGLDAGFLRLLYKKSRFIVAMRFHSLIFALSSGTPVIGITYKEIGPKIEGLLKQFSIEENYFSLDNFNEKQFTTSFDSTVKSHEKYQKQLTIKLNDLYGESKHEIKKILER